MIQNIQAFNVPINLSNDIFPDENGQTSQSSLWGQQDVALPGEIDGDGVVDNGAIPLRMILQPTNPATHTIKASEIFMEVFDGYTTVNGYVQTASTVRYQPTSTEYEDNLYPGYTGGSVLVREWINGASTTLTDGTTATINLWPNDQSTYEKVKVFDFNTTTNSAGTPGEVGNSVIVLAYVKQEHDILTNNAPLFLTANTQTTNDMLDGLIAYKLYVYGNATPITVDSVDSNTNVTTLTNNSWSLTVEAASQNQANFSVIPYVPAGINNGGSSAVYNGYSYQANWVPQERFRGSLIFNPTSVWWEGSVALPQEYSSVKSIFFWLVPDQGYVLSRHNVSVSQVDGTGTTTYFDYGFISGQYTGTSNAVGIGNYQNTTTDVFGTAATQGYVMDWVNTFPNNIAQAIEYDQLTGHPYETPDGGTALTSSYRGATKYHNVNATISSNYNNLSEQSQSLNTIFVPTDSSNPDITLIDSKQYTLGTPILGQFINSVQNTTPAQLDFLSDDSGAEFINNIMPTQYCTSDWINNSVLVNFTYLHYYIPGTNPNNIKITINGAATQYDNQQCIPFNVNINGGVDVG